MTCFDTVHCVIAQEHEDLYRNAFSGHDTPPHTHGGETRQQSVYNGLKALKAHNPDIVFIHDAARPCVTKKDIENLIQACQNYDAVCLAMPLTESVKRKQDMINREDLWIIQTPQVFDFKTILKAHETYPDNDALDDTTLYQKLTGEAIHYVPSGRHNLKITTQDDLIMAVRLLTPIYENITGQGFDVHAFDDKHSKYIRLCGVDIPHERSLKGHSDADVGLHALTDAILSTIGAGDIGTHFPPSNDDFKDMDSHIFLQKSLELLKDNGAELRHVDITLICEEPKIGPYREIMQTHLASFLNLPLHRVSIKATTSEQLGFTGRREGIACMALTTVRVKL
jgi:2-C-methyl-D-erythritol 4-phosphate cytidylyltransferase/2-C-methyl-D-erythritol 2,4-cyclodiphosphate synthase